MKVALFLCVVLAAVTIVISEQFLVPKTPGTPGHCYDKSIGPMEKVEIKQIAHKCTRASCGEDGTMAVEKCGIALLDGNQLKPDYTKPYPECCGQLSTK